MELSPGQRQWIGIALAVAAGAGTLFLLPDSWCMPLSGAALVGALFFGVAARMSANEKRPDNPVADMVLIAINMPAEPLKKIPDGWALGGFLITTSYLVSLAFFVFVATALAHWRDVPLAWE